MPAIIQYLLKLSVSAAVIYAFYYLVLRHLTFYNLNRWYLTGYTLLCFIIPFINIAQIADKADEKMPALNYIPVVQNINNYMPPALNETEHNSFAIWDAILPMLAIGSVILLGKLAVQMISFMRMRRNAKLISDKDSAIYHVEGQVMPFSFGRSIYLNKDMHSDRELGEIIMHEYVHVKQLHSVDILLAELFCVINWFNPFAWFIRHSIRQNLEFIADDNVVRSGINKKDYQYHLLKVVGIPQYRIANQFNFSSLKKRIIMMNRAKSAKIHLLKFLFILPLLAVTLMAFRSEIIKTVDKITVTPAMTADKISPITLTATTPSITVVPAKLKKVAANKNGFRTGMIQADTNFKETANVTAYFKGDVVTTKEISGSYIVILRDGEKFNAYENLISVNVKKGDKVIKGQLLGTVDVDTITGIPKLKFSIYNGAALVYDEDGNDTSKRIYINGTAKGYRSSNGVVLTRVGKPANSWSTTSSSSTQVYAVTPTPVYTTSAYTTSNYSVSPTPGTASTVYSIQGTTTAAPMPQGAVVFQAKPMVDSIRVVRSGRSYPATNIAYVMVGNPDELTYTIDPQHIQESQFANMEKRFADNGFKLKINNHENKKLRIQVSGSKDNSSSSASFSADDVRNSHGLIRIIGDKKTGLVSIVTYPSGK